jgi:hypothetical protein
VIVVRHSQADADSVIGESIEAIGGHVFPRFSSTGWAGGLQRWPDLLHGLRLALLGLRTIGSAGTLSLAGVLASVLLIAAALAFAVVLSLAGVLGELRAICSQRTGDDR